MGLGFSSLSKLNGQSVSSLPSNYRFLPNQHSIIFFGPLMVVIGGRTNNDEQSQIIETYDTVGADWYKVACINRYRHSVISAENQIYIHGGFEPEFPNRPLDSMRLLDISKLGSFYPKLAKNLPGAPLEEDNPGNVLGESTRKNNIVQSSQVKKIQSTQQQPPIAQKQPKMGGGNERSITPIKPSNRNLQKPPATAQQQNVVKNIRLSNQAIVATSYNPEAMDNNNNRIQKIPVDRLQEEAKKLLNGGGFTDTGQQDKNLNNQITISLSNRESLSETFIGILLRPNEWKQTDIRFPLKKDLILQLCEEVTQILEQAPNILNLRIPIKIFGSLFGRFNELMRFFSNFGSPSEDPQVNGDIEKFDYLFLGNYVDRGFNSLEVVCLLFALKLKFPDNVHLLRGNHEDIKLNRLQGLAEECAIRLDEDIKDPNSVFQQLNKVFQFFPLAALVEEKILCVHGGLGKKITSLKEIEQIQRPATVQPNSVLGELLWSDYIETEDIIKEHKPRDYLGYGTSFQFGNGKLMQFLSYNKLNMIIRGHEIVQEGIERNSTDTCISISSCPAYGGKYQNNGAVLKIKKNRELAPCVLGPVHQKNTIGNWINPDNPIKVTIQFNDSENQIRKRNYTPPKQSQQMTNN